ncbi:MAG: hypothetical protein NTU93_16065 [Arthrobacter sp.]|nr:hypothetical protein [Arthrobacter sp.]
MMIMFRMLSIFQSPENISQTFDNVFHLNAVRFILDSGSASSFTIGRLVDQVGQPGVYPAAWHALVSLVVQLTGMPIPGTVNVSNAVIAAVIWPSGCVYLATRLTRITPLAITISAISSAGFSQFPYLLVDFGVLYPLMLATAGLPFVLGALVAALKAMGSRGGLASSAVLVFALGLPGLAFAHPSALLAVLALGTPWILELLWTMHSSLKANRARLPARILPLAGLLAFIISASTIWALLRPDAAAAFWPPIQSLSQAFGEAVTATAMGLPIPVVLAALTIFGIYAAFARSREFWPLLLAFAIGSALYVVVSGMWFGRFRTFVTGGWYNDSYRVAALLPVITIPVLVLGAVRIGDYFKNLHSPFDAKLLRHITRARQTKAFAAFLVVLTMAFAAATQFQTVGTETRNAAASYQLNDASKLLSKDEYALLGAVDDYIPVNETVIGNPWTGASLVYAISNRKTLEPHMFGKPTDDVLFVERRLNQLGLDPRVCDAVRSLRSFWVLDFGSREVHDGTHSYPGTSALAGRPGFRLAEQRGTAKLYEVVGCR